MDEKEDLRWRQRNERDARAHATAAKKAGLKSTFHAKAAARSAAKELERRSKMRRDTMLNYDELRNKLSHAKEKISDLEERLEEKVSKNPVRSVTIAFGIGVMAGVVAYMLARKRR